MSFWHTATTNRPNASISFSTAATSIAATTIAIATIILLNHLTYGLLRK